MKKYFSKINSYYFPISIITSGFILANPEFDIDGNGQYDDLDQFNFDSNLTAIIGDGSVGVVNQDYLVAHVDGEIRGVGIASLIPFGPYEGGTAYLTTYGSYAGGNAENPGETISFYFYDGATSETSSLSGIIDFVTNASDGSITSPFQFIQGTPELFKYVQSTAQSFYLFNSITINGNIIEPDDWVGAFKDNLCVGARKWDTSECGNGICDVPVMGIDGTDGTELYMQAGDKPTFKIYDWSEGVYYDAVSNSEICDWVNLEFCNLDKLSYSSSDLSISSNVVVNYDIVDVYPNPFNPVINIDLNLKENDYLDINILNINGKKVDKIFKGYKIKGKYSYRWDASNFSSGVYLIFIDQLINKDVFKKIYLIK